MTTFATDCTDWHGFLKGGMIVWFTGQPWTVADTLAAAGLVQVVVEMEFTI